MSKEDKQKKKVSSKKYIVMFIFVLIGFICGVLMSRYLISMKELGKSNSEIILSFALLLLMLFAAIWLQVIIHEGGHLLFGLISGYHFSSFRIGSLMLLKDNEKWSLKKVSIMGTGGQCLMTPPERVNGKMPFLLYNIGGPLMNLISAVVFLGFHSLCQEGTLLAMCLFMLTIIGFAFAIVNGIPLRLGIMDNDGHNALSMSRNSEALRAFWIQMKVNELISKGISIKDMPEEWFTVPSPEAMKNSMVAVLGVFACNRLMEEKDFEEADHLMEKLLEMDTAIVGLHRQLMVCDRIYFELMKQNRPDKLSKFLDKEQVKFMKAMKNFPSVLRTEYAYALLAKKDTTEAERIMARFEKCARTYPYSNEINVERQFMADAKENSLMLYENQ